MTQQRQIQIDADDALVLFELLARFEDKDQLAIEHPAEIGSLWALQGALESLLVEPLQANYQELLGEARTRVRERTGV